MNRQQQQHRRQLLPLLRRWEAVRATATTSITTTTTTTTTTSSSGAAQITVVGAGHINSSRHWFHSQSSVADRSSFFVPRPFLVPREHRHQHQHQQQRWCRYYGTSGNGNDNGGDDDDERRDVQDQKSAFLRALEGNKRRNNHNNSSSSSSSSNNNTGIRRRNNRNDNQHRNDTSRHHHPSRSRNNNGNSNSNSNSDPRTKAFGSGGSKKLTLDEFFANLEQPTQAQTQTQTPQRTPTRSRGNQHGGQQERQQRQRQRPTPNREARHQYNRNNNNSSRESRPPTRARGSTALPAPAPASVQGMGSFFDDVDALMERKQQQQQQQQQTEQQYTETNSRSIGATASASATASGSSSSRRPAAPVFRSSIADMVGPSDPTTTASSALFGGDKQSFEGLGFGVESWDPYTELLEEIMEGPKFLAKLHKKKKKTTTKGKSKVQDDNHDNHDDDDNDNDNHVENEERTKRQIVQVVEWLRSPRPAVETQLPTLDALLKGDETNDDVNDSSSTESDRVRSELTAQKERFRTELGWTAGQYDVATGALVAMGGLCAKRCTAQPLDVAWSKLKEMGHPMTSKAVLHNYLYVAATFSFSFSFSLPKQKRRGSSTPGLFGREFEERIGDSTTTTSSSSTGERGGGGDDDRAPPPPPSVLDFLNQTSAVDTYYSNEEDDGNDGNDGAVIDVAAEVALCHDFFHKATEQSIGIHVRRLVHLGKANEAERLLDASMKSDDLRLRTYAPIYQAYLDDGDVSSAIQLFAKMKKAENVLLLTETYVQLIACIAENGYFRTDANKIDGIEDLEYSKHHGPALFDALASELAEHSIEITSASAKRLYNAFQRGFEGHNHNDPNNNSNSNNYNLRRLHLLESLRTDNDLARPDELIVSRVKIDASTGLCPRSGSRLRLINLDSAQKQRFRDGLSHLVSSSYQERHHTRKADVADKLNKFGEWLQHRAGGTQKPFTAIIDGPNVAYYMQNFQQGTFNYHQIKFVTDALENMGENVLVVMPKKYTYDSFTIQIGGRSMKQTLSQTERDIRDDLLANGKACVVPVGSLDDYYWMFASVSMEEEFVPPDNPDGRWPGNRPMLVSNDKLRDHKMSLLEPRLFRRWYSNFLVNFTFSAFVNDECVDREIGFRTADFYSREIQGNFDSNGGGGGGTVWHFPVKDWNENESMCIRIPNSENKKD